MSAKRISSILFILVLTVSIVMAVSAASLAPVNAVDNLFQALNAGEVAQEASALFAADAVAHNDVSEIVYEGSEQIGGLLDAWQRAGRNFEIVQLEMKGDTVDFTVEIADHGQVWARQRMTAEVHEDRITSLEVHQIQLQLWRLWD